MTWHAQQTRARRDELRRACARQRQRLVNDSARLSNKAQELRSWKTYAREYPLALLGAAAAAGLWLGSGPRVASLVRLLVREGAAFGFSTVAGRAWQELATFWESSLRGQDR